MKYVKFILIAIILALSLLVVACQNQKELKPKVPVASFEECVEAGNAVMESYPRQCRADGKTFVEDVPSIPLPEEQPARGEPTFTECTEQPEFCTDEYLPVCGRIDNGIRCITTPCPSTDTKTFSNGCDACSQGALGYYSGSCEEQLFVICKETITGFDPQEYAKNNKGICVDVCPNNYDVYTTQVGIQVCIAHVGETEITAWKTCSASSQTCNCVKAYETTDGEQIQDPKYRCVPQNYEERLLFRGGVDRLDEKGQSSVMIA